MLTISMAVDCDAISGRFRHSSEYWQLKIMDCEIRLAFTKLHGIIAHMGLGNHCLILWGLSMGNGISELALFDLRRKTVMFKMK